MVILRFLLPFLTSNFQKALAVLAIVGALVLATAGPVMAAPTTGSGGVYTDRLNQSFTAIGITSQYHIFASGLDPAKEIGLLLYMDGSGGYGLDNPNSSYLLDADGTAGLRQVARDNNMLLLTPIAPAPDCNGEDNCWFNESSTPTATDKSDWLRALVDQVYAQYPIEKDRVAIGGYSSGAQATARWFVPRHGWAIQTDGVFVAIAYGGAPAVSGTFPQSYKDKVVGYWNTGTADPAYTSAPHGAIGGYNWYTANGFTTRADWPAGLGHSRSDFASIMRAQIAANVRAAQPASFVAWSHTVAPTRTGAQLTVDIPAGVSRTTFRVSASPFGTQTGWYDTTALTGDNVKDLALITSLTPGTSYYYQVEEGTDRTVRASGTFRTLP